MAEADTSPPSDEEIKECLKTAEELKQEGNDLFRAKQWNEALASYRTALGRLPKRKEDEKIPSLDEEENKQDDEDEDENQNLTELEKECAKARAVMNANIGACYVQLEEHKEAVKACTQALFDDPLYIKALQRRAASNERLNTWSSLSRAQEDYTTLLALFPQDSAQIAETKRVLQRLKPRVEAAQKEETAEMMSKLKGIGNSLLGNFGLSTDNFKFEPNGQGGYSMNFSQ